MGASREIARTRSHRSKDAATITAQIVQKQAQRKAKQDKNLADFERTASSVSHRLKKPKTLNIFRESFLILANVGSYNIISPAVTALGRAMREFDPTNHNKYSLDIKTAMNSLNMQLEESFRETREALRDTSPQWQHDFLEQAPQIFDRYCYAKLAKLELCDPATKAAKYVAIRFFILIALIYIVRASVSQDPMMALEQLFPSFENIEATVKILLNKDNWKEGKLLSGLISDRDIIDIVSGPILVLAGLFVTIKGLVVGRRDHKELCDAMGSTASPLRMFYNRRTPKLSQNTHDEEDTQTSGVLDALCNMSNTLHTAATTKP